MSEASLTPRQERAAERLLEDEGLTEGLEDDQAAPLIGWASAAAAAAAALEQSDAELSTMLEAIRAAVRRVAHTAPAERDPARLTALAAQFLAELTPAAAGGSPTAAGGPPADDHRPPTGDPPNPQPPTPSAEAGSEVSPLASGAAPTVADAPPERPPGAADAAAAPALTAAAWRPRLALAIRRISLHTYRA